MSPEPAVNELWLSHHPDSQLGRCYRIGGVHVCARCLGLYPVFALALAAQWVLGGPEHAAWDPFAVFALAAPATLDWARGAADPASGSNPLRTATGVLAGLGLARAGWLVARDPLDPGAWLALLALVALAAVCAVGFRHRSFRPPAR